MINSELYNKNNFFPSLHLFLHTSFIIITYACSYFFFTKNYFILSLIFYLLSGFFSSFTGLTGIAHEFSHNTVFKNKKINNFFYKFFCIFNLVNYEYNLISHLLHHKNNSYEDSDAELQKPKVRLITYIELFTLNFSLIYYRLINLFKNCIGIFPPSKVNLYCKKSPYLLNAFKKAARLNILIHATLFIVLISFKQYFFLSYIFLPFTFNYYVFLIAYNQHTGLKKNTKDTFANTRSLNLNSFLSFLVWNMNYHTEHHLNPRIPYYHLNKFKKKLTYERKEILTSTLKEWNLGNIKKYVK